MVNFAEGSRMNDLPDVDIGLLRLKDALALAPLLAAYTQARKRGAPGRPDRFYAETLLQERSAEVLGARLGEALIGFAVFHDLPDPLTGARYGLCEHVFVHQDHRGKGIAKALVDVLCDQGGDRNWSRVVLNAPRAIQEGRRLYNKIAAPADWTSHVIVLDT
jgi:GNAT superfamily N-acetyltransferase